MSNDLQINIVFIYCVFLCLLQDCKIYLCGTKLDLIEEAIQPREVQTKAVINYGRGQFQSLKFMFNKSITTFNCIVETLLMDTSHR